MKNLLISTLFSLATLSMSPVLFAEAALTTKPTMKVYKSPSCGCCQSWVDYMRDNDFVVETIDLASLDDIKTQYGITPELQSCHTALVDGYVVEGHVPVNDVQRLLKEKPDIAGLTAPGMPAKSPGMGSLIPKDYSVIRFDKEGNAEVFSEY